MTTPSIQRGTPFKESNKGHDIVCDAVRNYFKSLGVQIVDWGVESHIHHEKDLAPILIKGERVADFASRSARNDPDFLITGTPNHYSHWCEVKTREPRHKARGNFAIEKWSHITLQDLCSIGRPVFLLCADAAYEDGRFLSDRGIIDGAKACWVDELVIERELSEGRAHSGSRMAGGLFSEHAPFMWPLRDFVQEQLRI